MNVSGKLSTIPSLSLKNFISHPLALLFLVSLAASFPLFHSGFYRGHDWILEFVRMVEYKYTLLDGGFPVHWAANLEKGYGNPIFNFFPPVFLWLTTFFQFLKFPLVFSAKLAIFLLTFLGGVGMYFFCRNWWDEKGSFLAAALFILAPYHFVDGYVRNAYSEFTALCLAPWVFHAITHFFKVENIKINYYILFIGSVSLFALSHNLSVLMYLPLLFLYGLFVFLKSSHRKNWKFFLLSLGTIFLITCFYTLPILFEKKYVLLSRMKTGKFNVFENFLPISWLFDLRSWPSLTPFIIILIVAICFIFFRNKNDLSKPQKILVGNSVGISFFLLFLTTSASSFLWKIFSFFQILGFPWRLLSPLTFLLCFSAGLLPLLYKGERKKIFLSGFFIFIAFIFFILKYYSVNPTYVDVYQVDLSREALRTEGHRASVYSEYLPIWASDKKVSRTEIFTSDSKNSPIKIVSQGITRFRFNVQNENPKNKFLFHTHYYPGWKVYLGQNPIDMIITPQGLIQFELPAGQHDLLIQFENTPIRFLGNFLSLCGLLSFWITLWIMIRKKFRNALKASR